MGRDFNTNSIKTIKHTARTANWQLTGSPGRHIGRKWLHTDHTRTLAGGGTREGGDDGCWLLALEQHRKRHSTFQIYVHTYLYHMLLSARVHRIPQEDGVSDVNKLSQISQISLCLMHAGIYHIMYLKTAALSTMQD